MAMSREERNDPDHRRRVLGSAGPYKFTPVAQEQFLEHLRATGRMYDAAKAAGLGYDTVRQYINKNINDMGPRTEMAMDAYRASVEAEIHRRAVEGWDEPIIGGKDRDKVVAHVRKYSDRLLEFHAKRHIPDYRAVQQIDLNVRGGVIAVPAQAPSIGDWAGAAATALLPQVIDGEVVDVTPVEKSPGPPSTTEE